MLDPSSPSLKNRQEHPADAQDCHMRDAARTETRSRHKVTPRESGQTFISDYAMPVAFPLSSPSALHPPIHPDVFAPATPLQSAEISYAQQQTADSVIFPPPLEGASPSLNFS